MGPASAPPQQLRLLMVSDFFYPNTGGVESHIYQLSQCLLARGHKVVVLTHAYGNRAGVRYLTNGLKVYYAPRLAFTQAVTFPTLFGGFRLLRCILLRERINLVHAHQAFSTMAHEAIMHARTMGYRAVFTDHSLFGFADASSILVNKVLKYTLADVHHVICVSHTSKENTVLRACIPPGRVSVIPNAVDASLFEPEPAQQQEQQQQRRRRQRQRQMQQQEADPQQPQDVQQQQSAQQTSGLAAISSAEALGSGRPVTVVALSRLVYRKGIDLLAAVLPELCERHPHVQFLIGGDGPKRALLERIVAEHGLQGRVALVGAVPHERVRQLLVQGHVFLNCSLTEAFCMALVEAAAAGLLVVSTRVGGVPEVLPPEMLLLADPSPEGLVKAVGQALERVAAGGRDAWAQHAAVRDMYSWQSIAARTEAVYRAVLRDPQRDDSMAGRLARYYKCGKWFGKICCCVTAVDWLYWRFLEWWQPAGSTEPAPDFPSIPAAAATGGKQWRLQKLQWSAASAASAGADPRVLPPPPRAVATAVQQHLAAMASQGEDGLSTVRAQLKANALQQLGPLLSHSAPVNAVLDALLDRGLVPTRGGGYDLQQVPISMLGAAVGLLLKRRGYPHSFRGMLNSTLDEMGAVLNVVCNDKGHRALVGLEPAVPDPLGCWGSLTSDSDASSAASLDAEPCTLPYKRVLGVECSLVTALQAAHKAVAWLRQFEDVAMDTEGTLARDGSLDVVQLFADGRALIFDLHGMQPAVRADVLGVLRELLEDELVRKVMHDCRADGEALFYLHGIRMRGVWDTQVAHAVLGAIRGMAGSKVEAASAARIGMNQLLEANSLPPNPSKAAIKKRMGGNPALWRGARPLAGDLLEYAVGDVFQLLALAEEQNFLLGEAGEAVVAHLSQAHAEWNFAEGDRGYAAGGARSYAAATKLPLGVDMQLILEPPEYRPRFAVALAPDEPDAEVQQAASGAAAAAAAAATAMQQGAASTAAPANSNSSSGSAFPSPVRSEGGLGGADENAASNARPSSGGGGSKAFGLGFLLPQLFPGSRPATPAALPVPTPAAVEGLGPAATTAEAAGVPALPSRPQSAQAQRPQQGAADQPEDQHQQEEEENAAAALDDSDAGCILGLFPQSVRLAIVEACLTSSGGSGSGSSGGQQGGAGQRRLVELCVDKGRPVVVRYGDGGEDDLPVGLEVEEALGMLRSSKQRLHLGDEWSQEIFYGDNRTGIPGTLHRISAIRGRDGRVLGLTYRIGRHVSGVSHLIMDLLAGLSVAHPQGRALPQLQQQAQQQAEGAGGSRGEEGREGDEFVSPSLLILGPPGVGKTTLLRDTAGILADHFRNRVIVVDTSNEIAGDGDIPHPCIGRARRMMVPNRAAQHDILLEAVQNHNPQVVIVDEIGHAKEVMAAKSIAQRGVVMVGTAHGVSLESLLKNPELNPLVGGVHSVLLGDAEAARSNAGMKTRTERRGAPCFSTLVEVLAPGCWRVHTNVAHSVDAILAGRRPPTQLRWVAPDGRLMVRCEGPEASQAERGAALTRQALAGAKGAAEQWLKDLINLAALY